jgi:hypothetical protein
MIVTTITPLNTTAELGKRTGSPPNVLGTSVSPLHSPLYFDNKPAQNSVIVTTIGQGIKGDKGDKGDPGEAGGAWLFVTGIPSNTLGIDGQTAYSTDTGNLYNKVSGLWELKGTITAKSGGLALRFSWGDATPEVIASIPAGKVVSKVEINLLTAFNVPSTLSVGDSSDVQRLFPIDGIDLTQAGKYQASPNYIYTSATTVNLYLSPGVGNTQGNGVVVITIED